MFSCFSEVERSAMKYNKTAPVASLQKDSYFVDTGTKTITSSMSTSFEKGTTFARAFSLS